MPDFGGTLSGSSTSPGPPIDHKQIRALGQAEAQAYTRGRISAYVGQINTTSDSGHLQRLESNIVAQQLVQGLDDRLTHGLSGHPPPPHPIPRTNNTPGQQPPCARTNPLPASRALLGIRDVEDGELELRQYVAGRVWVSNEGPRALFDRAVTWLRRNRCLLPGITRLAYLGTEVRIAEQALTVMRGTADSTLYVLSSRSLT
ncbi:DUF4158 domain-containing protein [Streptomyces sp. NBC_01285]|uniref:DUF4158 domain-containing protein n=2 Tax=Streptomyces TaxID=1883 RepID=UPI00225BE663|nr:DUF4158 domain-containing protein [Streptomyces sp. NBC_01285]MCX4774893.1 DUF4158 domain-containing protein [Streptomyces sp. NBC_01285]